MTSTRTLLQKTLQTLLPVKHIPTVTYHCEEEAVMQHDLMRTLAIQLSSKEPVELRERLIINPGEPNLPQVPETVNARLLSISTELENFPAAQHLSCLTTIRLDHISISSIITSILELENLQKLSLIMCKIGDSFNERTVFALQKLSITNCHELTSLSEGFGNLTNLDVLRLASCSNLTTLPRSFKNLEKLKILDISDCLKLEKLPAEIVYVTQKYHSMRSDHHRVKQELREVEEDKLGTLMKIIAS
ncbi:probable disease resistance protein [Tanacetum coccineum]|uniref:Probable disease resistance protein n=1 Tax=Tanacetum coccineum TaxID=301880 RepID=A0ABQ5GJW2_9ASTR